MRASEILSTVKDLKRAREFLGIDASGSEHIAIARKRIKQAIGELEDLLQKSGLDTSKGKNEL